MTDLAPTQTFTLPARLTEAVELNEALVGGWLAGHGAATQKRYREHLTDFAAWMDAPSAEAAIVALLTADHGRANGAVLAYLREERSKGRSLSTINGRLAAIRAAARYARLLGVSGVSIVVDLKTVVPGAKQTRRLKDTRGPGLIAERRMIRLAEGSDAPRAARDAAILWLLGSWGLRRAEIVELDYPEHVDLDAGRLSILGKARVDREWITLPEQVVKALRRWLEVRGTEPGPLFTSFDRCPPAKKRKQGGVAGERRLTANGLYRMVVAYGNKIGVKTRPHGFRHTAISTSVLRGDMLGAQKQGRHSSLAMTSIYADDLADAGGKAAAATAAALAAGD